MKLRIALIISFLATTLIAGTPRQEAVRILETAPLRFEPAADDSPGRFIARGPRCLLSFEGNRAILEAGDKRVRLQFENADPRVRIEAIDKRSSTTALYLGNDPSQWRSSIPNYGRLRVRDLYPGVGLVYYGNAGQLEYDLTVKPGADPKQVRLRLDGDQARVDRNGNLVAGLIQKRPDAYQVDSNGKRIPVESRYRRNSDGSYSFVLGKYDPKRDLVIDPVLAFSTYLSGNYQLLLQAIGLDKNGFVYVAGTTYATNLPVANHIQGSNGGGTDIYIAKINPNASAANQIVFSTYLGGTAFDTLNGMAISPAGDIYLTGNTTSTNFPTHNPAQSALNGTSDAFVVWITSSHTLGYSSFLGGAGDDSGVGVTFDSRGRLYVTGGTDSTDFPTSGALQTSNAGLQDVFVAMFDPKESGSATRVYSTYLGGGGWDIGNAIALAADGTAWVAGATYSHNFPQKGHSYQSRYHGAGDAFVAHINISAGSRGLEYSTYLGGSDQEQAKNVVIDSAGQVIVSGWTQSQNFPSTANALQTKYGGNTDAFVSILDPSKTEPAAQLTYSTFFGGSGPDVATDLKQDASGNLYLCGYTFSPDLPTTSNAAQKAYDGSMDAFALKFDPGSGGAAAISYLTYLGSDGIQVANGIDFDAKDNIYVAGYASGPIFSALHGAKKTSIAGQVDGFIGALSTKP